jgi:hypothetical protein
VAIVKNPSPKSLRAEPARREILSGWKEIAQYLGMAIRTLQRYESQENGPLIHRPSGKSRGAVIARKGELDAWITADQARLDSIPKDWPNDRTNTIGVTFLLVDSEMALTFSNLALQATNNQKRRNSTRIARKAYNSIVRLRTNIKFEASDRHKLDANLHRLKTELEQLGEKF